MRTVLISLRCALLAVTVGRAITGDSELFDQAAQLRGHVRQLLRRLHRFVRARRRALSRLGDSGNVLRDLGRAFGGFGVRMSPSFVWASPELTTIKPITAAKPSPILFQMVGFIFSSPRNPRISRPGQNPGNDLHRRICCTASPGYSAFSDSTSSFPALLKPGSTELYSSTRIHRIKFQRDNSISCYRSTPCATASAVSHAFSVFNTCINCFSSL